MLKSLIVKYKNNQKVNQGLKLFSATFVNIPLSIISSIVLTNYLGAPTYGDFTFIISVFSFAIIFFDFGIFQGGNRVITLNKKVQITHEYYGSLLLLLVALSLLMIIGLFIYSIQDSNIESKGLTQVMFFLIPFSFFFLLPRFYESILHADNRINELSVCRLINVAGHLLLYVIAYFAFTDSNYNRLFVILVMYLMTNVIILFYLLYKLKPNLRNLKLRLKKVFIYTRHFGFYVFLGSLIGVGMSQLSAILISYFSIENTGVGFFALAIGFSSPLKLIPNTLATIYYKDFADKEKIPRKIFQLSLFLSLGALIFLWIVISPAISFLYGEEFMPVVNLTYVGSLGMLLYGIADFYNRFLGAHGKGKLLRNGAIAVGFGLLIFNLILIPMYSETGAVIAYAFSGIIYFSSMFIYYKKYISNRNV